MSHINERLPNTPKKWLSIRIVFMVILIGLDLLFVMIGLSQLVFGSMEGSYGAALFGTMLIIFPFLEVMFMMAVGEVAEEADLSKESVARLELLYVPSTLLTENGIFFVFCTTISAKLLSND